MARSTIELESRVDDLCRLADRESLLSRRQPIAIRRDLPELFIEMRAMVEKELSTTRTQAEVRELQCRFQVLRHQGSWSAATIDEAMPGYRRSFVETFARFADTTAWIRTQLRRA